MTYGAGTVKAAGATVSTGQMRAGGEGGINEMQGMRGLFAHTHPPNNIKGFNPSSADMSALEELGQQQSLILWRGGIYQFGPQRLLP